MVIKLLTLDIHLPGRSSLKEKRTVLNSIKTKLGRQMNAAVAEVGHQEKWQRTRLAIVVVGNDGKIVESACQQVLRLLETDHRLTILDCEAEIR